MDLLIIIGVITFGNLFIIYYKVIKGRIADAILDGLSIMILNILIGSSVNGAIIAMTASLLISISLLIFPPKINNIDNIDFVYDRKSIKKRTTFIKLSDIKD
jgi:hypothetical protein